MLTHLNRDGHAHMVDVADKPDSERTATAEARVWMEPATLQAVRDQALKKGDVLGTARIAGIMGAKKTSELIPLCHPIPLTAVSVELGIDEAGGCVHITATARTVGKTGVEMEALTAVTTAALTVYDMVKALDRTLRIGDVRLLNKRGGVHGDYDAASPDAAGPSDGETP